MSPGRNGETSTKPRKPSSVELFLKNWINLSGEWEVSAMEERKRPCRRELLNWINVVSFAADDTKLFLDTHPHHQEAQQYF